MSDDELKAEAADIIDVLCGEGDGTEIDLFKERLKAWVYSWRHPSPKIFYMKVMTFIGPLIDVSPVVAHLKIPIARTYDEVYEKIAFIDRMPTSHVVEGSSEYMLASLINMFCDNRDTLDLASLVGELTYEELDVPPLHISSKFDIPAGLLICVLSSYVIDTLSMVNRDVESRVKLEEIRLLKKIYEPERSEFIAKEKIISVDVTDQLQEYTAYVLDELYRIDPSTNWNLVGMDWSKKNRTFIKEIGALYNARERCRISQRLAVRNGLLAEQASNDN